ncbi:Hypothetical predicted protein [Scomber scombrus]|uniref:Uncharacterized protein n=1 Tax=Scomber scombrus TaxID=13677 RepID=A0AAV1MUI9_SCOSC
MIFLLLTVQRASPPVYLQLICCIWLWRTETAAAANLIIIIIINIINICHFKYDKTQEDTGCALADQSASSQKGPVDDDSSRDACLNAA